MKVSTETKLHEKLEECIKLEEEVDMMRKELKEVKEQINQDLKLKGGSDILDVMLSAQK